MKKSIMGLVVGLVLLAGMAQAETKSESGNYKLTSDSVWVGSESELPIPIMTMQEYAAIQIFAGMCGNATLNDIWSWGADARIKKAIALAGKLVKKLDIQK